MGSKKVASLAVSLDLKPLELMAEVT